ARSGAPRSEPKCSGPAGAAGGLVREPSLPCRKLARALSSVEGLSVAARGGGGSDGLFLAVSGTTGCVSAPPPSDRTGLFAGASPVGFGAGGGGGLGAAERARGAPGSSTSVFVEIGLLRGGALLTCARFGGGGGVLRVGGGGGRWRARGVVP